MSTPLAPAVSLPQISPQAKLFTLIGLMLGLLLAALDNTIVATAGPDIQKTLHIEPSLYTWITTAYLVASTVMVPIYGKLSDLLGRKIVLVFGVVVFVLGSFLCGISTTAWFLILARAIQGLGSAALFTSAFSIIADLYPPAERGRVTGLFGAVFGLSSVLGPLVGGFITDNFGWHWAFFINLPLGLIALAFIGARMPALRHDFHAGAQKPRVDYAGALWLVIGVVPLLLALSLGKTSVGAGDTGFLWSSWQIYSLFGLAALGLLAFLLTERRAQDPLLDLSLFSNKVFAFGNLGAFIVGGAFLGPIIFLPLFMVNVVGLSATNSGLTITPLSLGIVAGNILSGQIVTRMGKYKPLMLISLGVLLAAFAIMAFTLTPEATQASVTLKMVLLGLGLGPSIPLYTLAIQNAVDPRKTGVATASATFFRQLGNVMGVAVLGTVFASTLSAQLGVAKEQAKAELPASARAQFDNVGSGGSGEGASSSNFNIEAIKGDVAKKLGEQKVTITKALRDNDRGSVKKLLADPQTPSQLREVLRSGGVAAKVHQTLDEQRVTLMKALQDNDPGSVKKLLASEQTPAQLREVLQAGGVAAKVHETLTEQKQTIISALRDNDPGSVKKLLASDQTPAQLRDVLQQGGVAAAVKAGFEQQKGLITRALQDNDPASVQALLASPQTPAQLRDVLQKGGIEAQVKAGFAPQRDLITRAIRDSDPRAIGALLANPRTPAQLRGVLQQGGVAAAVKAGFEQQKGLITRALQSDDSQAIRALLASPQTPAQLRDVLKQGGVGAAVKAGFARQRDLITRAIRDNDPQAVQALLASERTPAQLREVLQAGGVAAQVRAGFQKLDAGLSAAVQSGDPRALASFAQNSQVPGELRQSLAQVPGDALQTPEGQAQLLTQLRSGLASAQDAAIENAKQQALQGALSGLDQAQSAAIGAARQQAVQGALAGLQQAEPVAVAQAKQKALQGALLGLDQAQAKTIAQAKQQAVAGALSALDKAEPAAAQAATDKAVSAALAGIDKAEPGIVAKAKTQAVNAALSGLQTAEPEVVEKARNSAVNAAVSGIDEAQPKIMRALDTFGHGFKQAMTVAVRTVFEYGLLIVALALLASAFIPQVPLRKRAQAGPPIAE